MEANDDGHGTPPSRREPNDLDGRDRPDASATHAKPQILTVKDPMDEDKPTVAFVRRTGVSGDDPGHRMSAAVDRSASALGASDARAVGEVAPPWRPGGARHRCGPRGDRDTRPRAADPRRRAPIRDRGRRSPAARGVGVPARQVRAPPEALHPAPKRGRSKERGRDGAPGAPPGVALSREPAPTPGSDPDAGGVPDRPPVRGCAGPQVPGCAGPRVRGCACPPEPLHAVARASGGATATARESGRARAPD